MLNKLIAPIVVFACTACGGTAVQPQTEPVTLTLNRLQDGSLEHCDANGDCQTYPYDGECAVIEVDVDPETGATCERCILEDGTVIDRGCGGGVSVGCVLVTLPEPDCVVCAYVQGGIIFSSCVADEPECVTDEDCWTASGRPAFCINGQCIYDPGCVDDDDCPAGFVCISDGTYGTCMPREIECWSDQDCPNGMYCDMSCYEPFDCAEGPDCMPNPCVGVCRDLPQTCDDIVCQPGWHCEMIPPPCEWGVYCPPAPVCVPNDLCANVACPAGQHCEVICAEPMGGAADEYCEAVCVSDGIDCDTRGALCDMVPPECPAGLVPSVINFCYGPCVDPNQCLPMYCDPEINGCPAGFSCDLVVHCQGMDCPIAPAGICVPVNEPECVIDDDCPQFDNGTQGRCVGGECVYFPLDCSLDGAFCPPGYTCEIYCTGLCHPDDATCETQCWGTCVPGPDYCFGNDDCDEGEICLFDPPAVETGICVPAPLCGNGIVEPGEECDPGAPSPGTSNDFCTDDCRLVRPECVDGERQSFTCEDGNEVPWCFCEDANWICIISPENQCN